MVQVLEAFTGGTARHVCALLEGLPEHDVRAIVSVDRDPRLFTEIRRLRCRGVPVEMVRMRRELSPIADARALARILTLFRLWRPDIVHCHSSKAGFLGRAASRLAGVPVRIYTPHALPIYERLPAGRAQLYRTLERLAGRWTTRLIAVSPSEKRFILDARIVPADRVDVIPNGVPLPHLNVDRTAARRELGLPPRRPVVLCVGRLCPQKAPIDWVKMARRVLQSRPEVIFAWVGDGRLKPEFEAYSADLGDSVRPLGFMGDLSLAYASADVYAMASLWEACPYAVLDAMAWQVPCAVTSVDGCRDAIIHGENGLLSPPGDPVSLARNVLELLLDPNRARGMGASARETAAADYSTSAFLSRHSELYTRLACSRPQ